MASKKHKKKNKAGSGAIYVILSILVILCFLVILYFWHENPEDKIPTFIRKPEPAQQKKEVIITGRLQTNKIFSYPALSSASLKTPELREFSYFSLGYSEAHEQAAWVSYLISRAHTLNNSERRNNFRPDPEISTRSALPKDYSGSGYDRGHLAPAADFDFNRKALGETFFMSNISPQDPSFNRGGWKELEDLVRALATEKDSLWVVCGPVLTGRLKKIGANKVSVPNYFYKIILNTRTSAPAAIGFLMPNRKVSGRLGNFVVSVDSIEKVSGLDFFPLLPDSVEAIVEKEVRREVWFKTKNDEN